jgi:hypothetical protein
MKKLILVLPLLALSSCARTYISEFSENTVTACGNNAANESTIEETAIAECRGPATRIGGHLKSAGIADVGYGMYQNVNHRCFTYRCDRPVGPAPASVKDPEPNGALDKLFK